MTAYDYFLQNDQTKSVRRYPQSVLEGDSYQYGERWDAATGAWTDECADRRSCELTRDTALTEAQAMEAIAP